jgi:2-keto-3-deoxy-L-rhamnonate aldolase RhmA
MRKNTTLARLRDGKVALGTWLQLHSYQASRMLAAQGFFEWMLVDYEHTPVDRGLRRSSTRSTPARRGSSCR